MTHSENCEVERFSTLKTNFDLSSTENERKEKRVMAMRGEVRIGTTYQGTQEIPKHTI